MDGAVAGFAAAGPSRDEDASPRDGELYAIYVDPPCWRLGVGRALEAAALAGMRAAGFSSATLWVIAANPAARAFYEAAGWAFDGGDTTIELGDDEVPIVRYRRSVPGTTTRAV